MNSVKFLSYSLFAVLATSIAIPNNAAEPSLTIPRVEGEPTLADFEGMQPNTPLARSMS